MVQQVTQIINTHLDFVSLSSLGAAGGEGRWGSCCDFPKQTHTGEHLQFKCTPACKMKHLPAFEYGKGASYCSV